MAKTIEVTMTVVGPLYVPSLFGHVVVEGKYGSVDVYGGKHSVAFRSGRFEAALFQFGQSRLPHQAIPGLMELELEEGREHLDHLKWVPAGIEHVLAFGAQYPGEQTKGDIFGLNAVTRYQDDGWPRCLVLKFAHGGGECSGILEEISVARTFVTWRCVLWCRSGGNGAG